MTIRQCRCFFTLVVSVLGLVSLLYVGSREALGVQSPAVTAAGTEKGKAAGKYPQQVLIIRHGEKPDGDNDPHLTSKGAARAAALPSLFLIPPTFPTKPARFATPDFIFATSASKKSNRPVETVTPLSKALGKPILDKYKDDEYKDLVGFIFGDTGETKYFGKVILICWHHGKIPKLTETVVARAKNYLKHKDHIPGHWENHIYDRVFQVAFDQHGDAEFENLPQRLLFDDQKK